MSRAFNFLVKAFVLASACTAAHAQWEYSEKKIGIDEVLNRFAAVKSTTSLNLAFPYQGQNLARLTIRTTSKGSDIIIGITKGQLVCYQSCLVKIKIDDKPSRSISMVRSADSGVTNIIFVSSPSEVKNLTRELPTAKKLAIEMPIYGALNTVVEFDVSELNLKEAGVNLPTVSTNPAPKPPAQVTRSQDAENAPSTPTNKSYNSGDPPSYGAQIRACVQSGVLFPTPPRSSTNPSTQHRVDLHSIGTVASVKLTKSSGNVNFDRAVETGIRRCSPFPIPSTGKYPEYIDVNYTMYD
jgi:TonB family protein